MEKQDSEEDRISALPDDIICNVLSNLYVEESTRTSILSKRWRNMWLHTPITISDESIVKQSCIYCFTQAESSSWIVNAMSHIIFTHPGPIHTCNFILFDWNEYQNTLVNLLKILILKGIRNLQINIECFKVPIFVFECESLVNVSMHGGVLSQLPAHKNIFPNLRMLTLRGYDMSNGFLVNLFSSTSIIHLALFNCYGVGEVVIESDSLQKFVFIKDASIYDRIGLTITNVPNLESFECDVLSGYARVAISNAPKLKVLSRIDVEMWSFKLGNHWFDFNDKHVKISGEITYMPSLRSLDIAVHFNCGCGAKSVPRILVCFPCLETLDVNMKHGFNTIVDDDYDDYVDLMSNLNCLNHHLKNVKITDFLGSRVNLDFVRLIVANAKVLETLTIVYGKASEERWMKAQKHFLMQNRASKMVRVEFVKKKNVNGAQH